jgi:hypothetical protein
MSNWERRAEASTGGQVEDESTKMDNVIWKLNLIIMAIVCVVFGSLLGCMLQRSNSDVKSGAFASSVWMKNEKFVTDEKLKCMMKNGWNDNWVTNLNVSHITKFINSSVLTFHCITRKRRRGLTQME